MSYGSCTRVGVCLVTLPAVRTTDGGELVVLFVGTPPIDLQQACRDICTDPVDIDVVTDGRAAIRRLTASSTSPTAYPRPDLVLLQCDFELPDGMTVLHAIKSSPQLGAVPVVVLDTDDCDAETAYETGGNAYLKAPQTTEEYVDLIGSIEEFWFDWAQYPAEYL